MIGNIDCNKRRRQGQGVMISSTIKISPGIKSECNIDCNKRQRQGQVFMISSSNKISF